MDLVRGNYGATWFLSPRDGLPRSRRQSSARGQRPVQTGIDAILELRRFLFLLRCNFPSIAAFESRGHRHIHQAALRIRPLCWGKKPATRPASGGHSAVICGRPNPKGSYFQDDLGAGREIGKKQAIVRGYECTLIPPSLEPGATDGNATTVSNRDLRNAHETSCYEDSFFGRF